MNPARKWFVCAHIVSLPVVRQDGSTTTKMTFFATKDGHLHVDTPSTKVRRERLVMVVRHSHSAQSAAETGGNSGNAQSAQYAPQSTTYLRNSSTCVCECVLRSTAGMPYIHGTAVILQLWQYSAAAADVRL